MSSVYNQSDNNNRNNNNNGNSSAPSSAPAIRGKYVPPHQRNAAAANVSSAAAPTANSPASNAPSTGNRGGYNSNNRNNNNNSNNNRDRDQNDRDYDRSAPISAPVSAAAAAPAPIDNTNPVSSASDRRDSFDSNPRWERDSSANSNNSNNSNDRFGARDVRSGDYSGGNNRGSGGFDRNTRFSDRGSNQRSAPSINQRDSRLELELFGDIKARSSTSSSGGIEFKNYEDIPVETSGLDIPEPIESFTDFQISEILKSNIELSGYTHPTPVQKYGIPIGLAGRDIMVSAQTGSGKCWAAGTKLILYNGTIKSVESIIEGDELLGDDNTVRIVQPNSLVRGTDILYKIQPESSVNSIQESFTVNSDHILVLKVNSINNNNSITITTDSANTNDYTVKYYTSNNNNNNKIQSNIKSGFTSIKSAKKYLNSLKLPIEFIYEISVRDYLSLPLDCQLVSKMYKSNSVEFHHSNSNNSSKSLQTIIQQLYTNIDNEFINLTSYILGIILSNNNSNNNINIDNNNNSIIFNNNNNTTIIQSIKQWALLGSISILESNNNTITINDNRLIELLNIYNIHTTTNNSIIPIELLTGNTLIRKSLLNGIIDNTNNTISITDNNLSSIKYLINSLGYSLSSSNNNNKSYNILTNNNNTSWYFTIEELSVGNYYGFTVNSDSNSRFLLGDFTITHNTAAFLLPLVASILTHELHLRPTPAGNRSRSRCYPSALILAPTRELATQIHQESRKFVYRTGLKPVVVYGGADIREQLRTIERGCDILVATPGRLVDFLERGRLSMAMIEFLVFDEADRMLDMGFEPQIRQIVENGDMPDSTRQTAMFSATFPKEIQRLAQDFLKNYVFLAVGRVGSTTDFITQKVVDSGYRESDKLDRLMQILSTCEGLTLIFVETKRSADSLEYALIQEGIEATSIHGDRSQQERENALAQFRCGRCPVLVATDVASRGLDIPDVRCVVNYDLPNNIDDYVHRIGRTGRAGAKGTAIAFVNDKNKPILKDLYDIMKENNQELPQWFESMVHSSNSFGSSASYGYGSGRGGSSRGGGGGGGRGGSSRGGGRGGGGSNFGSRDYRSEYQGTMQRSNANTGPGPNQSNNNNNRDNRPTSSQGSNRAPNSNSNSNSYSNSNNRPSYNDSW